ncbi:MAG: Tn3 family transposase [Candidatus Thiodiazotropha sp. (ex. Lucinoma kazani)]
MAYTERLQILIESEIYDLYSPPCFTLEERRFYFALNDQEAKAAKSIRSRAHRCFFVALLGYFKSRPVVLNPSFGDVEEDLRFIAKEQLPGPGIRRFSLDQRQKDRLYRKIFSLLNYQKWQGKKDRSPLMTHLQQIAKSWIDSRYLFDATTEYLALRRIAIPKYTVIQTLVSQAMKLERVCITATLKNHLSERLSADLANLVNGKGVLPLSKLRLSARSFAPAELEKELKVNRLIQPWMSEVSTAVKALSLSIKNQQHFASMIDYYGSKIIRFDQSTQQLFLLCYLQERAEQNIERLADGFNYHVRKVREQAKVYAKDMAYRDWEGAAANVGKGAELLHFFIDDSIDENQPFGTVRNQAKKLLGSREIESLCMYLSKQKRALDDYYWEYYDQQKLLIEQVLRPIFLCLEFQASQKTQVLAVQLATTRDELLASGVPQTMDRRLIQAKQKDYLIDKEGNVSPGRFEWLLYLQISNKLKGQLHLPAAIKFRSLQDDLVSNERWKAKKKLINQSMLPRLLAKPNRLIETLSADLKDKLHQVSQRIENGDNQNVILLNRTGKTKWRLPSNSVKSMLNNPFFDQIKPINIADVLRYVDQETGFLDHFEHVLPIQSKGRGNVNDLLAAIIGNGTNYGLYGMANISDRVYDQLKSTQANYLRPETLNNANDAMNNAVAKLPIFKHYNIQEGLIHASADGQKFESRLETFKTRYSSKYFGTNKGVSAITLIANHAALNAKVIGSNEHESHYIFDLLQSNTSEIRPDVLSTDTHGVNHVNFALLDLFGYTFAPRYARFGKVIEEMFNVSESKDQGVRLSLKRPIKTDCIIEHWDTIQRIAISLQEKSTTQAILVHKLSGYGKNHPLLQALTEYNRMIKAIYLLDYIDDVSLRGYVQRALNRGEAYHQLRRAIASVNGNRFRGSSDYEISLWNECARLLTNAIIYFNSMILSRLLIHFEGVGDDKKLAVTKQVSPVAWHNINLNGTYSFSFDQNMIDIEEIMRPITENREED